MGERHIAPHEQKQSFLVINIAQSSSSSSSCLYILLLSLLLPLLFLSDTSIQHQYHHHGSSTKQSAGTPLTGLLPPWWLTFLEQIHPLKVARRYCRYLRPQNSLHQGWQGAIERHRGRRPPGPHIQEPSATVQD